MAKYFKNFISGFRLSIPATIFIWLGFSGNARHDDIFPLILWGFAFAMGIPWNFFIISIIYIIFKAVGSETCLTTMEYLVSFPSKMFFNDTSGFIALIFYAIFIGIISAHINGMVIERIKLYRKQGESV